MLFISSAPLIKKLCFPRYALCLAVVGSDMIHFLATVPILLGLVLLLMDHGPGLVLVVGLPILVGVQALTTFSVVLLVSTVNAVFRDLEQLVRVILLLLLYITPILFPVSMVPDNLRWILVANPLAPLIISWRALFMDNVLSPYVGLAILYAVGLLAIAVPVYRRVGWRLAELV
jgi:lipopolysaccharide transport system permease protein